MIARVNRRSFQFPNLLNQGGRYRCTGTTDSFMIVMDFLYGEHPPIATVTGHSQLWGASLRDQPFSSSLMRCSPYRKSITKLSVGPCTASALHRYRYPPNQHRVSDFSARPPWLEPKYRLKNRVATILSVHDTARTILSFRFCFNYPQRRGQNL